MQFCYLTLQIFFAITLTKNHIVDKGVFMAKLSQFRDCSNQGKGVGENELKNTFNKYKDMSKQELNQTLFEEVAKQKQEGKFDYNGLSSMVESLRGALPENDYHNIKNFL